MVICLEQGADLHMAQLMPLPLTDSCCSKIQIGFAFLVPAHPGSPGKRAIKRVCVCLCVFIYTHTFTHTFNSPLSRTTRVSRYRKDKTNLDFAEARDSEWQWHQLGILCKSAPRSIQIATPEPHHSVFYRPDAFLPPNQQRQNTEFPASK